MTVGINSTLKHEHKRKDTFGIQIFDYDHWPLIQTVETCCREYKSL